MSKKVYDLTEEGVLELEGELNHLKDVKRPENLQNLKEARAQGDLSENADYDAARTEQAQIEARIKEIEYILKNVRLIKATNDNVVGMGKRVKLLFVSQKIEREFDVVGHLQANPTKGTISVESPLGKAIRNTQVGDEVTVKAETGNIFTVKILEVSMSTLARNDN
ncbi:MAG TPA: transcription elongation factor GreA [Acholeplasmataceae bacterium]|nr:transcription elongation factor GreA [Acholeplasmataceae bacterium]HPX72073.1 transcription elongation factor GreA [Acholeplasmataceae bacterium]HQC30802.1 transcription elongation factor GreA [Acholeplasmataceae bacterium]